MIQYNLDIPEGLFVKLFAGGKGIKCALLRVNVLINFPGHYRLHFHVFYSSSAVLNFLRLVQVANLLFFVLVAKVLQKKPHQTIKSFHFCS